MRRVTWVILFTACWLGTACNPPAAPGDRTIYFASDFLTVEALSGQNLRITYRDATGHDMTLAAAADTADQTLYDENGITLILAATDDVFYSYPYASGHHEYAVDPEGIVCENEYDGTDVVLHVLFIDQQTGAAAYTAAITENAGAWHAEFEAPVSETVPVNQSMDLAGNTAYEFTFDNAAGHGVVTFWTDPGTHLFPIAYIKL